MLVNAYARRQHWLARMQAIEIVNAFGEAFQSASNGGKPVEQPAGVLLRALGQKL